MNTDDLRRVKALFLAALDLPPAEREAYVDAQPDPAAILDQVRRQLRALEQADRVQGAFAADDVDAVPESVGPYRVVERISEGGMGVVYLAEQEAPVRRQVALKLIKPGMDSKAVLRRFAVERQALAMMEHSCIAKVFDAGLTESGQPYFAMEYVPGDAITTHCDRSRLSLRERIELFQQVCAGVQHAHLKGVMHRDLKPSNVLVTMQDGRPVPRIIDFGLAKATDGQLSPLSTMHGVVIGTPEYMSPEQAGFEGLDIDTRTDVYSLGVLLYELLTGERPFRATRDGPAAYQEIQRRIREEEPSKPSTKVSTTGAAASEHAAARRLAAPDLSRRLRGDLDWIVLRALEKDRARRYATAQELAADLQRYLDHQPVLAGPPTTGYRVRKFVRRYRVQCLAAAAVLLALIAGGVGTSVQWLRAEDLAAQAKVAQGDAEESARLASARAEENAALARQKAELLEKEAAARAQAEENAAAAEQRAAEVQKLLEFQNSYWNGVDVEVMGARLRRALLEATPAAHRDAVEAGVRRVSFTTLAVSMLDENLFAPGLEKIGTQFDDRPGMKAWLLQSVVHQLLALGLYDRAQAPQDEALALYRELAGEDDEDTLRYYADAAALAGARGQQQKAKEYYEKALAGAEDLLGPDDPFTLTMLACTGQILEAEGEFAAAEARYRRALETRRDVLGSDHPETLSSLTNLTSLLQKLGRLPEAEVFGRECFERCERTSNTGMMQAARNNLALVLAGLGQLDEAAALLQANYEAFCDMLGDQHPRTLSALANVGWVMSQCGRLSEAAQAFEQALAREREVLGDDHPETIRTLCSLSRVLVMLGDAEKAEPLCLEVLEWAEAQGRVDYVSIMAMGNMLQLRQLQGRNQDALEFARRSYRGLAGILGEGHPQTVAARGELGVVLSNVGQAEEGEQKLREAVELGARCFAPADPQFLQLQSNLASVLLARQDDAGAEAVARQALEGEGGALGPDHVSVAHLRNALGAALMGQGRLDEAEPLLRAAHASFERAVGALHPRTVNALSSLANVLISREDFAAAVDLLAPREAAVAAAPGGAGLGLANVLYSLGVAFAGPGAKQDRAAAERKLTEALARVEGGPGPSRRLAARCAAELAKLHHGWHDVAPEGGHDLKAEQWRQKAEELGFPAK